MNKTIVDLMSGETRVVPMDEEEIAAVTADAEAYEEKRDERKDVELLAKLRTAAIDALLWDLLVQRASEPDVPQAIADYLRAKPK